MQALIIGAAGFLGKELVKDFSKENEVFAADKYENVNGLYYLDLLKKNLIKEIFSRVKPDIVLLTASITGVDFCEQNQDIAWQVNAEGPKHVAVEARKQGSFLVFYSSDYIFDGKNGPYPEEARPQPLNAYGRTKLEAEKIIEKELKKFLIIRTCGIYGYEKSGKNYAMQVWENLSGKKIIKAVSDQFGTPVYVEDLSKVTLGLVNKAKEGIFNVVGPDYVNRVQFAGEVAGAFDFDKGLIQSVATKELNQPADRPKKGGLKIDKLRLDAGLTTMGLREGLLAMKNKAAQGKTK